MASIPTLVLILASLILAIAMNRFVRRELAQISMLLAQGHTPAELLRHYLLLPSAAFGVSW